jgi:di/tricarboxylate transporter
MTVAAIVILTLGLLSTAVLPEYLTALIFFFLSIVLAGISPEIVFSGFFSGAVWLVFGGLILGVAIVSTGLAARIAGTLEAVFAGSYARVITGTVLIMVGLAFVIPSSIGRVMIMLPIVMALADRMGFAKESNGRAGLILATAMGSLTPTFAILPASVPNVALAGAAEAIHGVQFSYGEYLILHFPVIGLVSTAILPVFIILLFPDKAVPSDHRPKTGRLSSAERRLLCVLFLSLILWATDRLHGVSPAWVALGAGIFCALPGTGVLSQEPLLKRMDLSPIIFLAGVIGLGVVVSHSGIGKLLATHLIGFLNLGSGSDFETFAAVVGIGTMLELVTTLPGQPAIMTSFADTIAVATEWPLLTVLMTQVSAWALVMFPYQAPPLVATRALSGLAVGTFLRLMIPMAVFGWVVMVPLQYIWWRYLGYLP